jgi:hypothetical protein
MLNNLQDFKPAEKLIIIEGTRVDISMLLKLTLVNLIHNQALSLSEFQEKFKSKRRLKSVNFFEISRGINFESYQPKTFERAFFNVFISSPESSITLNQLMPQVTRQFKSKKEFIQQNLKSQPLSIIFKQNLFQTRIKKFYYRKAGKLHKKHLENRLRNIDNILNFNSRGKNEKTMDHSIFRHLNLFYNEEFTTNKSEQNMKVLRDNISTNDRIMHFKSFEIPVITEIFDDLELGRFDFESLSWGDLEGNHGCNFHPDLGGLFQLFSE